MYNGLGSHPTLTNVTFNNNSSDGAGGAISNAGGSNPIIRNSILWADTAVISDPEINNNDTSAPVVTYSDIQGGYPGTGNLSGDPKLGPLANNGGPTPTMALLSGSAAIDNGDDTTCASAPVSNLDQREVARPLGEHCDIGAYEYPGHLFADVPVVGKEWMEDWIRAFYNAGITTGCGTGPLIYCPESAVTRAALAVFLLRAEHGPAYEPPPATHTFADMPVAGKEWMEPWVDQFYAEGLTTGCGTGPLIYCPESPVLRGAMAVFLLRAIHGSGYTPPAASGVFADVPVAGKEWMEPWIIQFYNEGITTGCGTAPLIYCPENSVTRAAMAVFIDRAYSLYP